MDIGIDLFKCNNFRWKSSNDSGFIKTDGKVICLMSDRTIVNSYGETVHVLSARLDKNDIRRAIWLVNYPNFRIIPRNPEKYMDWQVDDVVRLPKGDGYKYVIIKARVGDIVITVSDGNAGIPFSCEELFTDGGRLDLKEYEKCLATKQILQTEACVKSNSSEKKDSYVKINHAAEQYAHTGNMYDLEGAFAAGAAWMLATMTKWLNRKEQEVTYSEGTVCGHGLSDGWDIKFRDYLRGLDESEG